MALSQEDATDLMLIFNAFLEEERASGAEMWGTLPRAEIAIHNARIQFVQYVASIANGRDT